MVESTYDGIYQESNFARAQNIERGFAPAQEKSGKAKPAKAGLSVIILNLNRPDYIVPLVSQLITEAEVFRAAGIFFEVIIGDTGSTDKVVINCYKKLAQQAGFRVVPKLRYHFSRNNNKLAHKFAQASHYLFMNNDIILHAGGKGLKRFYEAARENAKPAVHGVYLHYADSTIQHAGVYFSRETDRLYFPYHAGRADKLPHRLISQKKKVPAVTGAFMLLSRELFESCGGFDERYEKECQDIALCLSANRLGAASLLHDIGKTIHIENGTRVANELSLHDRAYFLRCWKSYIEAKCL